MNCSACGEPTAGLCPAGYCADCCDAADHNHKEPELLFEAPMACPECGCRFCGNCFGALCDCVTVFYRHDVSHCDPVYAANIPKRQGAVDG